MTTGSRRLAAMEALIAAGSPLKQDELVHVVDSLIAAGLLLTAEKEAELRAQAELDERERWLRRAATGPNGERCYLSTGCQEDTPEGHDHCKSSSGIAGVKVPATSKFSGASCVCSCHRAAPTSEETS